MRFVSIFSALFSVLALCVLGAITLLGCEPSEPQARAAERFSQCTPCHGAEGQGRADIEAPSIAGLPAWYVEAQLHKFRDGVRGVHFDDLQGMRMRPMALTLPSEDDVTAMATYVSLLPSPGRSELLVQNADDTHGKQLFGTCSACHGADGAGNQALNAPAIAGQPDWYVLTQLKKFKTGVRGAHPKDVTGASMRAIAMTLVDEQAMKDVARYVASLERPHLPPAALAAPAPATPAPATK